MCNYIWSSSNNEEVDIEKYCNYITEQFGDLTLWGEASLTIQKNCQLHFLTKQAIFQPLRPLFAFASLISLSPSFLY